MNAIFATTMSEQQIRYVQDAIAVCRFPLDRLTADVTFTTVAEPPAAGHNELMCTQDDGGGAFTISIRQGIDSADSPSMAGLPNPARDVHVFFVECILHELGHVAQKTWAATDEIKTTLCGLFHSLPRNGDGAFAGTLEDWSTGSWVENIEEAVAESWKDGWCPPEWRIYDNRTIWRIGEGDWDTLIVGLQP